MLWLYLAIRSFWLTLMQRWIGKTSTHFIPRSKSRPSWTSPTVRSPRKPDWVTRAILHLKVWAPKHGCRRIADTFNRQHADQCVSVSKSFVARLLVQHSAELARLRRTLNHRARQPDVPQNHEWAMDLTQVRGKDRMPRLLLGLIDYGSRACLALHQLADKRSRTIWRELLALFRQYGVPRRLRVDNESSFNSRWLKFGLRLLGVRVITTRPHSPWQPYVSTYSRHQRAVFIVNKPGTALAK